MTATTKVLAVTLAAALAACLLPRVSTAQEYQEYPEYTAGPPVSAAEPTALMSEDQLDSLLGPIALYPDSLLAQVLPAATYPLDIVKAAQLIKARPDIGDDEIDSRPWEPSVKAIAHYPTVLKMLADNAEWTQAIGAAFLVQRQDVMDSIQRLRRQALDAENLQSTAEQQVIVDDDAIQILPSSPEVMYVPQYDPQVIYVRQAYVERRPPLIVFIRRPVGRWLDCSFDWHRHHIMIGSGWHHGWRYEGRSWRPVDRTVVIVRTGSVVRYSGRATVSPLVVRHWSHNDYKPRPKLPPPLIVRRDEHFDHRDVRPRGPAVIHAKPFEVPRPIVRTADTHRTFTPTGPLHVERRSDVDDAVRRANESRSSWSGKTRDDSRGDASHGDFHKTRPLDTGPKATGSVTPPTHTTPPTITKPPPTFTKPPAIKDTTPPPTITRPPPTFTKPPAIKDTTPPPTHTTPPTITRTPPTFTKPPVIKDTTPPPTITRTPPTFTKPPVGTLDKTGPKDVDSGSRRFVPGATAKPSSPFGADGSTRDTDAASQRGHRSLRG